MSPAGWPPAGASPVDPLGAEVWAFDPDLSQNAAGAQSVAGLGSAWREGRTRRDAHARQHAVSCSKRPGWKPSCSPAAACRKRPLVPIPTTPAATLGLSYAAIVDPAAPLVAEPGQPVAWMNLDHQWEGCFSDDPSRIRRHAQWLRGLTRSQWRTRVRD